MTAVSNLLGDAFERFPDLKGKGHSTLTSKPNIPGWKETYHPAVYDDVLAFLKDRL